MLSHIYILYGFRGTTIFYWIDAGEKLLTTSFNKTEKPGYQPGFSTTLAFSGYNK